MNRRTLLAVAVVVGLILFAGIVTKLLQKSPQDLAADKATAFTQAFLGQEGSAADAYALATSSFKNTTTLQMFTESATSAKASFPQGFKRKDTQASSNSWVTTFEGTGKDGTYTFSVMTVQDTNAVAVQYYSLVKKW